MTTTDRTASQRDTVRLQRPVPRPVVVEALALDRAAFVEWWYLVERKVRVRGILERLFARAYAAGFAAGRSTGLDDGHLTITLSAGAFAPAETARANERRAS